MTAIFCMHIKEGKKLIRVLNIALKGADSNFEWYKCIHPDGIENWKKGHGDWILQ